MAREIENIVGNSLLNSIQDSEVFPIWMVKFGFDSGNLNLWSGLGPITYNGDDYTGTGSLGSVEPAEESSDIKATGARFTITGLDSSIISTALTEDYQNRTVTLFYTNLDTNMNQIGTTAITSFVGRLDTMTIREEGETATISVTAENRLVDFEKPRESRYTREDQRARYPGDIMFDFGGGQADEDISWGIK